MNHSSRRALSAAACAFSLTIAACSHAKSYQVNRVSAYGFLKCASSALRTQLRYTVTQPNDSTLIGSRKVGNEMGTITVNLHGLKDQPTIEIIPKDVPNSDRDALLQRCNEWTR
jgi:hypothetical protein